MAKVFEDYFSEYQVEMIKACLKYADDDVDKVFIYGSREGRSTAANVFFEVDGKYYRKHQLDLAGRKCDASQKRQFACLDALFDAIFHMEKKCREFDRPMPTELKIIYDVKKNSVKANYRYDPVYTNDPVKTGNTICDEWFEELKKTEK